MPCHSETNLGLLDYETARDAWIIGLKKSKSNYRKYFPNERYNIGKYASGFGTASTSRRFKAEQRGRPLMLGKIDLIVQNYLRVVMFPLTD